MRPSFPGLLQPRLDGEPACALAFDNANSSVVGASYGAISLTSLPIDDGFTLAANVLTCYVEGVYRLKLLVSASISAGGVGYIAYRINGGTEVALIVFAEDTSQFIVPHSIETLVKLGAGDTIELRAKGNAGGETITTYAGSGLNSTQLSLEQVSTYQ